MRNRGQGEGGMEELDRLAAEFGTDKGTQKVGRLSPKGYTRYYARHFAPLREAPIRLLEIGIASGASIRMWEAFFPNASIHGLDPACRSVAGPRVRAHIGGAGDRGFLRSVVVEAGGAFDIVIDDGGHEMRQRRTALEELFPALTPGSLYGIEDLHTAYWAWYGGGYRRSDSTIEFLKGLVDHINGGMEVISDGAWHQRFAARFLGRRPQALPPALARLESVSFYPSIAFLSVKG
jgi:hypothetical protein